MILEYTFQNQQPRQITFLIEPWPETPGTSKRTAGLRAAFGSAFGRHHGIEPSSRIRSLKRGEMPVELGGELLEYRLAALFIVDGPFPARGCKVDIEATPRWKVQLPFHDRAGDRGADILGKLFCWERLADEFNFAVG